MCSYLKNRNQRKDINNNFSATKSVTTGIPQAQKIDHFYLIYSLITVNVFQ